MAPGAPAFFPPAGIGINIDAVAPGGTYTWIRGRVPNSNCSNAEVDGIVIVPFNADVGVSMALDNSAPVEGDTVTYTITATNNGPDPATGLTISDVLPSGLTFASVSSTQGGYSADTWTVGTLGVGGSETLTLRATVDTGVGGMTITNTASVASLNETDSNASNDSASASLTVASGSPINLRLTAMCSPNPSTIFRWRVRNDNPYSINFTWQYFGGGGNAGTNTVPAAVGATPGEVYFVTPATVGSVTMQIFVGGVLQDTKSSGNTICSNDLGVELVSNDYTPNEGDEVTLTARLVNNGPFDANNVQVSNLLPAGLSLNVFSTTQGTYTPGTGIWDIGDVPLGGIIIMTINATLEPGTGGTNVGHSVSIANALQPDSNAANDSASITLTVGTTTTGADLRLIFNGNPTVTTVGSFVIFSYNVVNNGPDPATGVTVLVSLPAEYTFVSSAFGCTESLGVITCPLSNLINGGSTFGLFTLQAIAAGNPTSITAVVGATESDPNTLNNTVTETITINQQFNADLGVIVTPSVTTLMVGETVTMTYLATNSGPDDATSVLMVVNLPAEFVFVSSPSGCSESGGLITCSIGALNALNNSGGTFVLQAVAPGDPVDFTATISGIPSDPNSANDTYFFSLKVNP